MSDESLTELELRASVGLLVPGSAANFKLFSITAEGIERGNKQRYDSGTGYWSCFTTEARSEEGGKRGFSNGLNLRGLPLSSFLRG